MRATRAYIVGKKAAAGRGKRGGRSRSQECTDEHCRVELHDAERPGRSREPNEPWATQDIRKTGKRPVCPKVSVERVVRPTDLAFLVSYANRVETLQVPTSQVALLKDQAQTIRATGPVEVSLPTGPIPFPGPRMPIPGVPIPGVPIPQRNRDRPARLYDSLRFSIFHYLKRETGRKALLIVALSDDQHSESALEDALIALQQNDVIAYVVQVTDGPHDNCDVFHIFSEGKLRKLAEDTGGLLIEARGMNKIADAFDQISEELHHQYSLGYYPDNTNWDGRFRKIQIDARSHGDRVTARKGYYAIPPQQR